MEEKKTNTIVGEFTSSVKRERREPNPYLSQSRTQQQRGWKQRVDVLKKRSDQMPPRYKKLVRNTLVCAIIALSIWGIKNIDTQLTNQVSAGIQDAVTSEFQVDEDLGRLKFVMNDGAVSASSGDVVEYSVPVEGQVLETFASTGEDVRIQCKPQAVVNSMLAGTVLEAAEDSVCVKNDNGTLTIYQGIKPCVSMGDKLQSADPVGEALEDEISIKSSMGSEYIDSLSMKAITATQE